MDSKRISYGLIGASLLMTPDAAMAGKEEDAFAKAGYTVCDAKLIGIAWSSNDFKDMVKQAGEKIINGYEDQIKDARASGRTTNNGNTIICPPEDVYSAADIALFSAYWDVGRSEGRDSMSQKLLLGQKYAIDDAIAEQKKKG